MRYDYDRGPFLSEMENVAAMVKDVFDSFRNRDFDRSEALMLTLQFFDNMSARIEDRDVD